MVHGVHKRVHDFSLNVLSCDKTSPRVEWAGDSKVYDANGGAVDVQPLVKRPAP